MRETDLADELFRAPGSAPPTGVRVATARRGGVTVTRVETARRGGVTVTRVEIAREGWSAPAGGT